MDVVLVDRCQRFREPLRAALLPGDQLVEVDETLLAAGRWWPAPGGTRAVLLGVRRADALLLRALHRLWAAEHGPACYLLTAGGSRGERLLRTLVGPAVNRSAGAHWRLLAHLSLSDLLALERLAALQNA